MAGTAFNSTNWTGYDEQSWSNPSSALTDFTGIIDISNLSASFGSNVQSDGADIRVTKGDDTELAYDLIDWDYNSGSPTGFIRFLWSGTLSSSGTQNVRVWAGYAGGTATAYSANETYGSDNAYDSNWEGYWPLSSDFNDRTSNGNDGTGNGGISAGGATGKIGDATDFDGSDDNVDIPHDASLSFGTGAFFILVWIERGGASRGDLVTGKELATGDHDLALFVQSDLTAKLFTREENVFNTDVSVESTGTISTSWTHIAVVRDGSGNLKLYINGANDGNASGDAQDVSQSDGYAFGANIADTNYFDGKAGHFALGSSAPSADWIALEYDQTNDNATFWGTWTWNSAGGGGISIPVVMHHRRLIGAA
jgi:hypothetical protein